MAFNNRNNRNNKPNQKKKQNNNNGYFVQNSQKFGKDFLSKKRSNDIKRDAPRIFKDIGFSNGFVGSIGEYFLDRSFIKNLIIVASEQYQEYSATVTGLTMYYKAQSESGMLNPEEKIQEVLNMRSKQAEAYNIILIGLNNILNEIDTLKFGRDKLSVYLSVCEYLRSISFNLKPYRHLI